MYDDFDNPHEAYQRIGMEMVWMMRDSTEIKIKNMGDNHIRNCIRMLRKNNKKIQLDFDLDFHLNCWIDIFEDVLLKRRTEKIDKLKKRINE